MPRANGHPDADLDRLLPSDNPHHAYYSGGHGQLVGIFLRMESRRRRRTLQPFVLGHRFGRHGFAGLSAVELRVTSISRSVDVHHHQDDFNRRGRRAAAVAATNYAVDDAGDDRRLYLPIPGRSGNLHIAIQHRRRGHPVLRRRPTTD